MRPERKPDDGARCDEPPRERKVVRAGRPLDPMVVGKDKLLRAARKSDAIDEWRLDVHPTRCSDSSHDRFIEGIGADGHDERNLATQLVRPATARPSNLLQHESDRRWAASALPIRCRAACGL